MISVMSFNIRYGIAEDGANSWERRKERVIERIRSGNPDLLGMQECRDDAQAEFIKNNLQDYHFYGVPRGGGDQTALEMAPVLFRKSSFQPVKSGCFWLSTTPQIPGSKSWGSVFARTVTWVQLLHRPSGREIVFLNTHFDYQPSAIDAAARLLKQHAAAMALELPTIVTGDFNAEKNSAAYLHLTQDKKLLDAYRQVHPGGENEATFHGFGQPDELAVIDWILVSDHFAVLAAAVDDHHAGSLYPSDHYPVLAELTMAV